MRVDRLAENEDVRLHADALGDLLLRRLDRLGGRGVVVAPPGGAPQRRYVVRGVARGGDGLLGGGDLDLERDDCHHLPDGAHAQIDGGNRVRVLEDLDRHLAVEGALDERVVLGAVADVDLGAVRPRGPLDRELLEVLGPELDDLAAALPDRDDGKQVRPGVHLVAVAPRRGRQDRIDDARCGWSHGRGHGVLLAGLRGAPPEGAPVSSG